MTTPAPNAVSLPAGNWDIDPHHSNVEFVARHLLSRVRGRFKDFAGRITVASDPLRSSVDVDIDASSIDTDHEERDAHLRSSDFLDNERFPSLSFRSTSVGVPGSDGRFRIDGDLTIRNTTRRVALDTRLLGWSEDPWGGIRAAFSARTEIDRDDFGANWNVVLETGSLLVGKTVQVELEIEAILDNE